MPVAEMEAPVSVTPATGLGNCTQERCGGTLSISTGVINKRLVRQIKCERCGHNHVDHPMVQEFQSNAAPKAIREPKYEDYVVNDRDRMARLEKAVGLLKDNIKILFERILVLEKAEKARNTV